MAAKTIARQQGNACLVQHHTGKLLTAHPGLRDVRKHIERSARHHYAAVAVSGQADPVLYIDGVAQTIAYRGGSAAMTLSATTRPLHIGALVDAQTGWMYYSSTVIDETAIYNRALSASEIQALYNSGSAGKCTTPTAPFITAQPANQTVTVGGTATFTVMACGTPPLSYQWHLNGTNLAGATGTSLTLSNVQLAQAGTCVVRVTNAYGSTNSADAVLTVNQASVVSRHPQVW